LRIAAPFTTGARAGDPPSHDPPLMYAPRPPMSTKRPDATLSAGDLASIAKWLPEALLGYLDKTKPDNVSFQLGDSPSADATISGAVAQSGDRVVILITITEKTPVLTFRTSTPRESI